MTRHESPASAASTASPDHVPSRGSLAVILSLYLLGIFMGAIDTGIVTPARTLIQSALGVDGRTGIWMITIYTLAFAAVIPISGKLADRLGRKSVYLASIGLFGAGSLVCALSATTGQFWVLLAGRVIQAMGGGGIMPIAIAEFGTTFPQERRGMALGLVGGVYGIANILGSTAGSAILDIFGKSRWDILFLINVPISVLIVAAGLFLLPNNRGRSDARIDWAGIPLLSGMVLALLYGLRNVDFFSLPGSLGAPDVYPYLIAFFVLLVPFLVVERRAADPVLNLSYFTSGPTLITLALGFAVGVMMMGMVFVPQFAENALGIATGSGGYFVALLGLFAGFSSPASGTLVDRIGPKKVLYLGLAITLAATLFLVLVAIPHPGTAAVLVSLAGMGLGLGFIMGTPLNYMMLAHTEPEDSNSALATLSLVRSIGTAIAPAIMIGFLAHAGMNVQPALMKLLPEVKAPVLPHAAELATMVSELKADPALKADPRMAAMLDRMQMPSVEAMPPAGAMGGAGTTAGASALPPELLSSLQNADVTTIVDRMKDMAGWMFDRSTPKVIDSIRAGLGQGIAGMEQAIKSMDGSLTGLSQGEKGIRAAIVGTDAGLAGIDQALAKAVAPPQIAALTAKRAELAATKAGLEAKLAGMASGAAGMSGARNRLVALKDTMTALDAEIVPGFAAARADYLSAIEAKRTEIQDTFRATLNEGFTQMYLTVAIAAIASALLLACYRPGHRKDS